MATIKAFFSRTKLPAVTVGLTVGVVLGATGLMSSALAVHAAADPFEVDGNPTQTTADDDWNNVFDINAPPYANPREVPETGSGETFVVDGPNLPGGKESAAWSGSNKDIDTINTWEYAASKVTPDKDNITNAYAKAYSVPGFPGGDYPGHPAGTHSHLIIYFGADRFANNGDAALGFWFFKGDVGLGPNGKFAGEHQVGDLLVQADFVSGGSNSQVQIFKWVGSGGNISGTLQEIVPETGSNGTAVCTADDRACVITNNAAAASPWAYTPKAGAAGTFPSESFFEGGVDVTALVGQVCFSSFMAETRSSHSETAELKDFALGDFDLCSVDVEKVCFSDNGTTSPKFDPVAETYTTRHTVTITNDGFGPIYDVKLTDNAVTATRVCSIASISGGTNPTTVPAGGILFANNSTPQLIAGGLAGGQSITVGLVCVTDANPFANSATASASASPGGTQDVTDYDPELAGNDGLPGCTLTLGAGLKLTKFCQGDPGTNEEPNTQYQAGDISVFLNPNNGYAPQVCVDIALSNLTSSQRMVIDTFSDTDVGNLLPAAGLTLAPQGTAGDTYYVSKCYNPTAPDGNQTNPGLAAYSDTVSATGHGKTQPIPATATPKTATCKLCPTCPSCPPG
ncbi:hypothetical protein [Lysobacter fragariae]